MLNTAMVKTMVVVTTVRHIRGQGRFATMPDDFRSHRREAEAFLLHCWEEKDEEVPCYVMCSLGFLRKVKTPGRTDIIRR